MSSESSRFQHLLQPIRDLSKNWNIDLAQELEEYLDELEHLSIAFDPTTATTTAAAVAAKNSSSNAQLMNFAEAALLIQGTSMIYSRKVEYLYALVFQTLAHLSKQQHDATGEDGELLEDGGADGSGGEDDGGAAGGRKRRRARGNGTLDVWANPLPIYDEVEEAKNITLKIQNQTQVQNQSHKRTADMAKSKNNIQASIALMGSLVPDERDHGETFKLLSCHLHPSGVLLMDDASKKYLQDEATYYTSMATATATATASQRLQQTPMAKLNFSGNLDTSMASDGGQDPYNGVGYDDDDDNNMDDAGYDYGGGGDDGDDGDNATDPGAAGGEGHDDQGSKHDIFSTPMVKPEIGQSGDSALVPMATTATMAAVADAKHPWAALDPYDASKSTVRPFRKGRSYPVRSAKKILANKKKLEQQQEDEIDGVDDPGFQERFLLSANRPQWSTWVWNDLDHRALEQKFKKKYCKAPCLLTSCESLWKLETKWKSLVRKSNAASAQSAQAILIQEQGEEEEQQQLQAMAFVPEPVADPDSHDGGQGDDDDDDDDGGGDNGMDYGGDDDWDTHNASALSLLDASSAVFKNGGVGLATASGAALQDGDRALSYEEICRQHLEEFMKGTEKYIRETDLTRQVNDWQNKLSPILKEQDAHPPFDIQRYGREIIGHLEATAPTTKNKNKQQKDDDDRDAVPFSDVVGGLQSFEVCRMFLASLQLANNGNVELRHAKTARGAGRVPLEMQLLTTANAYESLQT